jgi:HEPN domain-containing protein
VSNGDDDADDRYGLWPRGGVSVFTSQSCDTNDVIASMGWYAGKEWFGYSSGYEEAARHLVTVAAGSAVYSENLAFPIVFLARQAVELKLKETILDIAPMLGVDVFPRGHDLRKLWIQLRQLMRKAWPDERGDLHERNLESLIEQWQSMDPGSTTFRYPENQDGTPSRAFGVDRLNLTAVVNGARRMLAYFDAVGSRFHEEARLKAEIEAACAQSYGDCYWDD